jgi:hypothetical protein
VFLRLVLDHDVVVLVTRITLMPRKAKSKRQARFFGAVAGGKSRKKTGLSSSKAREMLRGTKMKRLPERKKRKR